MTPSVAATSATVAPTAPFAVASTAAHDREWWAVEAVRAGTDWSSLVAAALEMVVAAGIIGQPEAETITAWDGPSWRQAAANYYRDRPGRRSVEIEPKRLERLRRLLPSTVPLTVHGMNFATIVKANF